MELPFTYNPSLQHHQTGNTINYSVCVHSFLTQTVQSITDLLMQIWKKKHVVHFSPSEQQLLMETNEEVKHICLYDVIKLREKA